MKISELLLPEFDQEMARTRKVLERIPNDKLDWKAHPKSNTIGWVGSHLVEMPSWTEPTLTSDSWDFEPPGGEPYRTPMLKSSAEMVARFDEQVATARAAIAAASDVTFMQDWSLLQGGKEVFKGSKYTVIRSFTL
ncbi:MAG: DinB family protein, partial [Pirellulales bacterium]